MSKDEDVKVLHEFYLKDKEKFSEPTKEEFNDFKKLLLNHDKTWEHNLKDEQLDVWTKESDVSSVKILKSKTTWNHSSKYIFEMLKDHEFFVKNCAEDLFLEMKMIETIDESNCVLYCKKKKI